MVAIPEQLKALVSSIERTAYEAVVRDVATLQLGIEAGAGWIDSPASIAQVAFSAWDEHTSNVLRLGVDVGGETWNVCPIGPGEDTMAFVSRSPARSR
jgi:hypothetical protein